LSYRDSSGRGDGLEPRRDIHTIAIDVVAFDNDVAKVDTDAEFDATIR
jgi:hypothetical protein